ncbi:MAG: FimB/Mfa2 family fimbrial subunit [Muribaculaceae bacterium]|nr:FimB/Mfa2 family fimbrial subunit [Muribaculaceae bacterium]
MNKFFKNVKVMAYLLSMLFIPALISCSDENDSVKDPVYDTHAEIKFLFEESPEFKDEFADKVKSVALYVFDENEVFVKVYEDSGEILSKEDYKLAVDGLAPGKYSCIAWCGLKDKNDGKSYFTVSDMKEGVSTRQELVCRMSTTESAGETISDADLNDLFYGSLDEIVIPEENALQTSIYTISLIQDTKELEIVITDVAEKESLNPSDYIIRYEDNNSILGWDNNPTGNDKVCYLPYSVEEVQLEGRFNKSVVAKLKVNRLIFGSNNTLTIYHKDDLDSPRVRIPLVDYIAINLHPYLYPGFENLSRQERIDVTNKFEMTCYLHNHSFVSNLPTVK